MAIVSLFLEKWTIASSFQITYDLIKAWEKTFLYFKFRHAFPIYAFLARGADLIAFATVFRVTQNVNTYAIAAVFAGTAVCFIDT